VFVAILSVHADLADVPGFTDLSAEATGRCTPTNVKHNVRVSPLGASNYSAEEGKARDVGVDSGVKRICNVEQVFEEVTHN